MFTLNKQTNDVKVNSVTKEIEIEVECCKCDRTVFLQLRQCYTQLEYENALYGWGWTTVNGRPICNVCVNRRQS